MRAPANRIQSRTAVVACGFLWLAGVSCSSETDQAFHSIPNVREDHHSYSNPDQIRVTRVELDLDVSFERKSLEGTATLVLKRENAGADLVLDTRDLNIATVEASGPSGEFASTDFELGPSNPILGAPLTITLSPDTERVRVHYSTNPGASGLQWLGPAQTAGKKQPFLFTQSQAIHARSWIPLQDSPGVRVAYAATIRTPKELFAVMSAEMEAQQPSDAATPGEYHFQMPQPIPSYLIALAVGDIEFQAMSERTGVYAEPSVVARAAKEFEDTEDMMQAVEKLYGPYQWQRYDILVLPPSFPFGGMENPRLTFATPTILAGDKSLVSLVAHELAHSWSGNLVTNATWRDFWLNEGFTVYLENRIQEAVFGRERADMEASLEVQELEEEFKELQPRDQVLHVELKDRDPDDGFTLVPYVKGMLLLRSLEEAVGRDRFDTFLRSYFDHFSFRSITTADFLDYLSRYLLSANPELAEKVPVDDWLLKPGLPASAVLPASSAFEHIEALANRWFADAIDLADIPAAEWTTQEWLRFLRTLPEPLDPKRMGELDKVFSLSASGNSEILHQWLLMSVRNGYEPAYPKVEAFLTSVGRRKFLKPLYTELAKTEQGKQRAMAIYKKARPLYHPIAVSTIDETLEVASE
jgi:leukotriene A-4 hydrolase/aminopeptidase